MITAVDCTIVRFDQKQLLPTFFNYYSQSIDYLRTVVKECTGTTRTRISRSNLALTEIPIPPLPEQQRIVGILDEAFAGIATAKANTEKNLQNARALFESHLNAVFSQRGDGWEEKKLADLSELITKGSSPKWQGIAYVDRPGILFVTSENVGEYRIMLGQPKYVSEKFNVKDKKSILKRGDVLTNIVGASIGRTAVFDADEKANINQAVCLIRCKPHLLNNYFLCYLLNSPVFKQVLHDNEVNNARANLSLGFFSQLPVPLPPIEEQQEIVDKLSTFRAETQHLSSLYERKLAALEALKKSLLHQAFNGEL
jgi:type I restriction enzyme S subunit